MIYQQEITLDLNANLERPIINAKQKDDMARTLLVHLTRDGEEYRVDSQNHVVLRVRKPDTHLIMNNCTVNSDGTVTVTFTWQCLVVAGRAYADLVEFNSSEQVLSSVPFIINIIPSPDVMGTEAVSSDEFQYLMSFINQGNDVIGEAQAWATGRKGDAPAGEPQLNNNAKYYSEQSENSASDASNSADAAANSAGAAANSADAAANFANAAVSAVNRINSAIFHIDMNKNNTTYGHLFVTVEDPPATNP